MNDEVDEEMDEETHEQRCAYYLLCTNTSDGYVKHPILGRVPTCQWCAEKHGVTLHSWDD